jgi:molecular chaperone DnaK
MSSSPVLGIDLGTTNSVVAVADGTRVQVLMDGEGNRLIPSVVSFHPQGDVLVGYEARERRLLDAENTIYSVKRLIGRPFGSPEVQRAKGRFAFPISEGPNQSVVVGARNETYTLPEISAFVLREVRRVAELSLGTECSRAVITVPANFNELQRAATKAAGKVAGLEVMRIVNEPTAAALAYGYGAGARNRERIAVFDLGGGTFDITILELSGDVFEVMSTAGDTFLGGDDIDLIVADQMADVFLNHHRFDPRNDAQAYERLRAAAEWSKCQLTTEPEVHLRVEELAYGDGGASLDLTFGFSRSALEKLSRPLLAKSFAVCDEALRIAGIAATQLDNVILVGGSTRMPLVRQMVKEYFGREALATIDPDLVVAQGAALQGYALRGDRGSIAPSRPLARVALKRVPSAAEKRAEARRSEIIEETAAARPRGPAFAPKAAVPRPPTLPPVPPPKAPDFDEERTSVAPAQVPAAARPPAMPSLPSQPPGLPPKPATVAPAATMAAPVVVRGSVGVGAPPAPPISLPPAPMPSLPSAPLVPTSAVVVTGRSVAVGEPAPAPPVDLRPPIRRVLEPNRPGLAAPPAALAALPIPVVEQELSIPAFPGLTGPPADPFPALPAGPISMPMQQPMQQAAFAQGPAHGEIIGAQGGVAPLLLDVTPQTLGVETVGGYCESVIKRNAAIPVEQSKIFSTALDGQSEVRVRVTLGESRKIQENQPLGELLLGNLRQGKRGAIKISVTFLVDADGTLSVRAKDMDSGQEQYIRVQLVGSVSDEEIQRMQARQNQMLGV